MLENLVEEYLEILDSGRDDPDLYEELRNASKHMDESHWWDVVRVARELHLQKQALAIERSLLSKIPSLLKSVEKMSIDRGATLGEYIGSLVQSHNLLWPDLLEELGISPRQSHNFSSGKAALTSLLTPQRLAHLGKRLGANAAAVLSLARRELGQPDLPVAAQVSYRTLGGFHSSHVRSEPGVIRETAMLRYLAELEKCLIADQC